MFYLDDVGLSRWLIDAVMAGASFWACGSREANLASSPEEPPYRRPVDDAGLGSMPVLIEALVPPTIAPCSGVLPSPAS